MSGRVLVSSKAPGRSSGQGTLGPNAVKLLIHFEVKYVQYKNKKPKANSLMPIKNKHTKKLFNKQLQDFAGDIELSFLENKKILLILCLNSEYFRGCEMPYPVENILLSPYCISDIKVGETKMHKINIPLI